MCWRRQQSERSRSRHGPLTAARCAVLQRSYSTAPVLERDELWFDRHPALAFCLSMIFSENRIPLFRIMLWIDVARRRSRFCQFA
jgi:hypothetical protein